MSSRRTAVAVFAALLVLTGTSDAGALVPALSDRAEPSTRESSFESSLPWQWQEQKPAQALVAEAQGRSMNRAEFEKLQAEVLAAGAGLPAPEFVFPNRAGDLDGDGKNDVLTVEFLFDGPSWLNARSGLDGDVLWTLEDTSFAVPADVDGDGDSEVLTITDKFDPIEEVPGVRRITEVVSLLDGATGEAIWTYTLEGSDSRIFNDLGFHGHDHNWVSALNFTSDATGDGRPDVWVGTSNGFFSDNAQTGYIEGDLFVGRTLEGSTGLEIGRVAAAGDNALPWAIPAGDVSGDGLADVVSVSGHSWETGVLSAWSAFGTPWWVKQVPSGQAYLSAADLNGDGRTDVTAQTFHQAGPTRFAYDGATGDELWAHPDNGYIDFAGDIDGDGGSDLIQILTYDGGVTLNAWSGADGAPLYGPVDYPAAPGAWTMFCFCTNDVTGDGIWDPLTAAVVFSDPMEITVRMHDGADGSGLWGGPWAADASFPVPIGADADGDGAEDVGFGAGNDLFVKRGTDLASLWTASGEPGFFFLGFYGDDVLGDAGAELVAARAGFVDESFRGSAAVYGPGTQHWATQ